MQRVYEDDGFEFERLNLLGATYGALSDVGEVLVTIERIPNADHEAWLRVRGARRSLACARRRESYRGQQHQRAFGVSARLHLLRDRVGERAGHI